MDKSYELIAEPQMEQDSFGSKKLKCVRFIASDGLTRHVHHYDVSEQHPIDGLIVILAADSPVNASELGGKWTQALKRGQRISMGWYDAKFLVEVVGFKSAKRNERIKAE